MNILLCGLVCYGAGVATGFLLCIFDKCSREFDQAAKERDV